MDLEADFLKALGIDFLGLLLFGAVLYISPDRPLGLAGTEIIAIGLVFPLIAYTITNRKYREQFWKAFLVSAALGVALFLGGLWLFIQVMF
jgi:hypothetical protein